MRALTILSLVLISNSSFAESKKEAFKRLGVHTSMQTGGEECELRDKLLSEKSIVQADKPAAISN